MLQPPLWCHFRQNESSNSARFVVCTRGWLLLDMECIQDFAVFDFDL